jgi:hypothetical protein
MFFKLLGGYRMGALDVMKTIQPSEQDPDVFLDNG